MKELDEATIRLAAKKNQSAFKRLYDYYAPFVWKVTYRTVNGDKDAASEIVQETFIRVYMSLGSFGFNAALSTWIYRIALNAANTYWAKRNTKRIVRGVDMELFADAKIKQQYENEELVHALMSPLSVEDRFVLMSREVEGISFEELAQITGKSSESLRTQVSRLKARLRGAYEAMNKKEKPL